MNKKLFAVVLISASIALSGCAAVVATGAAVTGLVISHDRRTTGTFIDDKTIQFKVLQAIKNDYELSKNSHISVIAYNNSAVLVGQTPTQALRKRAEEIAQRVQHVERVYNELTIAGPSSLLTRSSDTWITTKIKTEMLVKSTIDPTRIKVITEDGVVYLLGLVTPEEDKTAVNVSRNIKGVKKVVKIFEYTRDPREHA